ncbi:MAG: hypothetical protein BWK80_60510, partial [Desulfobacteraceae bacterium IS3]
MPGDYAVRFDLPPGYAFTKQDSGSDDSADSDANTVSGRTTAVTLAAGEHNPTIDAGIIMPVLTDTARLGDYVWYDTDQDGIQDPDEKGIAGVTVNLIEPVSGRVLVTVKTDGSGYYEFAGLNPGGYAVEFVTPPRYEFSPQNRGVSDASDSDADQGTGRTSPVVLSAGENDLTLDAGMAVPGLKPASLGDYVWYDTDHDGVQDTGEPGVSGVTANLLNPDTGSILASATTDGTGYYEFAGLLPGAYQVQFILPPTYSFTTVDSSADSDSKDSDADMVTGLAPRVILAAGEHNPTIDAGIYIPGIAPASLGNYVWHDLNRDGIQQDSEPGIADVTVKLISGSDGRIIGDTKTDGSGFYEFAGLAPGDYSVWFMLPSGYRFTTADSPDAGDSTDSDANQANGRSTTITLGSGEHNPTIDAGVFLSQVTGKASLGDYVWYDTDQDGIQDSAEQGIAGVTVKLIDPATGRTKAETVTDGSGYYGFSGLQPGSYAVEFVPPQGYTLTLQNRGGNDAADSDADATGRTAQIVLSSGEHDSTLDAGMFIQGMKPASLGDYVWFDENQNGIQDSGEPGVAGVKVNLTDAAGKVLATSLTDGSGYYLFAGLAAGSYTVDFEPLPAYRFTLQNSGNNSGSTDSVDSDADTGTGQTSIVTLSEGEHNPTIDAGIYIPGMKPASLGNFVWYDEDRNGVQDSDETGIPDVRVSLYDKNGVLLSSTFTDADGYYEFAGLAPSSYTLLFDLIPGNIFSPPNRGSDTTDSDVDMTTGRTPLITLTPGENRLTEDVGMFPATVTGVASLGDYVWYDSDNDGIQDSIETGIAGVTVNLIDPLTGRILAVTSTDGAGHYGFTGLNPGSYIVGFVPRPGYEMSKQNQGGTADYADAADSDADTGTGLTAPVTLVAGEHNPTIDAGMFIPGVKPASLGDRVWYDENRNGIQDSGEPGIAGVTVNLIDADTEVILSTSRTDGSGYYDFSGLAPGKYIVEFDPAPGYRFTSQDQGRDDAVDSDADTVTRRTAQLILAAGEHNPTIDAGLFIPGVNPASIGDYVWNDANRNGMQDSGEAGIPDVRVSLYDKGGVLLSSATTDSHGFYQFTGLAPGDYAVKFDLPDGYEFTTADYPDASDSGDSDADASDGFTGLITLTSGEDDRTVDAGMFTGGAAGSASLGDYVWYDTDHDGIQDADEPGIAGVTVRLTDPESGRVIAAAVTDGSGYYVFTGLKPGDYAVEFVRSEEYQMTLRNQGGDDSADSDADTVTGRTASVTLAAGEHNPT